MIRVELSKRWAVRAQVRLVIRADLDRVWQIMERLNRFATTDPYHTRITDHHGKRIHALPPRGTRLRIGHGLGWTWFEREGVMLHVKPGKGFAFADLSKRGRHVGFPHVYRYSLSPLGENTCELTLQVRGRWSAQHLPHRLVWFWLWWVMFQANWLLRARLLLDLKTQRSNAKQITTTFEKGTPHA